MQYTAFPGDPRKSDLLSAGLVMLNAGIVELFIFGWAALSFCILQRRHPLYICGLWQQHCTVPDDWRKTVCHPIFVWVDTSLLLSRHLEQLVFFNFRYLTLFPGIPMRSSRDFLNGWLEKGSLTSACSLSPPTHPPIPPTPPPHSLWHMQLLFH